MEKLTLRAKFETLTKMFKPKLVIDIEKLGFVNIAVYVSKIVAGKFGFHSL